MKRYILAVVIFSILGGMGAAATNVVPLETQYHHASAVLTTPIIAGELQPATNTAQLTVSHERLQPTTTSQQLQPTISSTYLQPAAQGNVLSTATTISVR